jgi:hypothetical protein
LGQVASVPEEIPMKRRFVSAITREDDFHVCHHTSRANKQTVRAILFSHKARGGARGEFQTAEKPFYHLLDVEKP